jgi:hypothetical protein
VIVLWVEDITKANIVAGIGFGAMTHLIALESVDGNQGLDSDSSSSKFVFGSVSGNFQVICNFSG